MDESIRSAILYFYNEIRDIQSGSEPYANGMPILEYDLQLEQVSKCWSARCINDHTDCFVTTRFTETSQSVGQLILEENENPKVLMWMQMINLWVAQSSSPSAENLLSLPGGSEGEEMHNYAQIMSDQVRSIGCSWSLFEDWVTFVCTYGPRGTYTGESIFRIGDPCSQCPTGYSCDYSKPFEFLCKPLRSYQFEFEDGSTEKFYNPPQLSFSTSTPVVPESSVRHPYLKRPFSRRPPKHTPLPPPHYDPDMLNLLFTIPFPWQTMEPESNPSQSPQYHTDRFQASFITPTWNTLQPEKIPNDRPPNPPPNPPTIFSRWDSLYHRNYPPGPPPPQILPYQTFNDPITNSFTHVYNKKPSIPNYTAKPEKKSSISDGKDSERKSDDRESERIGALTLVIYLAIGSIFIIVGAGIVLLVMYALDKSCIFT